MRNVNYYFEIVLNKGRTKSDLKFKWYKLKSFHPLLRKMEIANKSKMNSELVAIVKLLYFYFLALRGFNADQIFLIILLHNAFQFICTTPTWPLPILRNMLMMMMIIIIIIIIIIIKW